MPRPGQSAGYFGEDQVGDTYGITSIDSAMVTSLHPDRDGDRHQDDDERTQAQQELVSRALSPQLNATHLSNPCLTSLVDARLALNMTLAQISRVNSESVLSSRPGTPLSVPSLLPIQSISSSNPEDSQSQSPGPILVMPSIHLTPQKSYTDIGRQIGKLRIAFCGDSGSGKTTLLRTIASCCPEVVHFENAQGSEPGRPTTEINEVRASTQPYPSWKLLPAVERADNRTVIERNLCLVDTPGYALSAEADDAISPILRYVEGQFEKINEVLRDTLHLSDEDFLNLVAAPQGGLTQIDAAIYCTTKPLSDTDMTFIHKLTSFTTVIPVITKADVHGPETNSLRSSVRNQLEAINFPFFEPSLPQLVTQPFLVSCTDAEMEASVMMEEHYTPKLFTPELETLTRTLFHDAHPARLRHHAAQKFLAWKSKRLQEQSLIHLPESDLALLPSADFTISRIAEHTRQEDKKTRLRIAAWASEMRNTSLALAASTHPTNTTSPHPVPAQFNLDEKSADWLIARMNDYIEEERRGGAGVVGSRRVGENHHHLKNEADPLGLIRLCERWSRRTRRAFKWLCDVSFTSCGLYLLYRLWERMNDTY